MMKAVVLIGLLLSTPAMAVDCVKARQALGMPCWLLKANAHYYEAYTPAQKRQADACFTRAERATIKACFR